MNSKTVLIAALISNILVVCSVTTHAQRSQISSRKEQTAFSRESEIANSVKVPNYVLQEIDVNPNASDTVKGSLVNLNNDGKPDLVVQTNHGTDFWILHNAGGRWKLIFTVAAHGLSIDKTYTNGYRDISIWTIQVNSVFGSTYNYNLETYTPRECWTQNVFYDTKANRHRKSKIHYIDCEQDNVILVPVPTRQP